MMSKQVSIYHQKEKILTYPPKEPNKVPMFIEKKAYQGASGRIYPLPFTDQFENKPEMRDYDVVTLENEYIKVQTLPELGGRIQMGYDKKNDYHFIYHNSVIKPAMIGICGPWVSGGIEFNWPQHHRPTTYMPLSFSLEENEDGSKTVWMGEIEPLYRQKGMVGVTVCPGRSYIKAKVRLYNGTGVPQNFMWWANLAVHINEDYRVAFPPDLTCVCDHDRRAVISYPIMKGVFQTAKPFDYGEGTDASWLKNIVAQTSIMAPNGGSDLDFLSGYDYQKNAGFVHVANHHISPGKKLFTWGATDFGRVWQDNLTDSDGYYCELMTGVYTDNQPDFSWIMPYETKEFEQIWYPIRSIGKVSNATIDGAVSLEIEDGKTTVGFCASGVFKGAKALIISDGKAVSEEVIDIAPDKPYLKTVSACSNVSAFLYDKNGRLLVGYDPAMLRKKEMVSPRLPAKRPEEIETAEELFINGLHLQQYKHHTFVAEDYYKEGLKRDPGDIRCNLAMGKLYYQYGRFEEAESYFKKAEERLISRNTNPYDTEVYYYLGLIYAYFNRDRDSYDSFYKAVWTYTWRSAGFFELAKLDLKRGNPAAALEHVNTAITTNTKALHLHVLKAVILRKLGDTKAAEDVLDRITDPLDTASRLERFILTGKTPEIPLDRPEDMIDMAELYAGCGLYEDALQVLKLCGGYPLAHYYQGYMLHQMNQQEEAVKTYQKAETLCSDYCFPCRIGSIRVLKDAIALNPKGAKAFYYLGCLYYDKFRYSEATELWEQSAKLDGSFYIVHRNLALAYYEKCGKQALARPEMEKAFEQSKDSRILFELIQLYKCLHVEPEELIAFLNSHIDLVMQRDDTYQELMFLYAVTGDYTKTLKMLSERKFDVAEGAEGRLTRLHDWLHTTLGNHLIAEGKLQEGIQELNKTLCYPESYGEGRAYLAPEAHVYYYRARAYELAGDTQQAEEAYQQAAYHNPDINEITYFEGLALQKLGNKEQAEKRFSDMVTAGQYLLDHDNEYGYYGVGMRIPQVFDNNIVKINRMNGLIDQWLGYKGLGQEEKAAEAYRKLMELDPYNQRVYFIVQNQKEIV